MRKFVKKSVIALTAAFALLLTACTVEIVPQNPTVTANRPETEGKNNPPATSAQAVSTKANIATAAENTTTVITEPVTTVPQVIPPTYSEEEINSGYLYLSGKEQFVVSKNKNIITIILDAADNIYLENLLKTNPEAFNGLEDFTLYNNTCSYFDSTFQSVTQIYSGYTELPVYTVSQWSKDAWTSDKANEFYNRFHKAGYKMNFFVAASLQPIRIMGKFDNLGYSKEPLESRDFYHLNEGFTKQLDTMKTADNDFNYFIVEHIHGAHTPLEKNSFEEQMTYLFDIVRKYLDKLKEFKVYDDSTIIIMSDHGSHDIYTYPNATPIFLIKEAGKTSDKMKITSAPISFEDLMSTYLISAGLFNQETDRELFGSSIYDFDENSKRERTANYRIWDENYPESKVSPVCPSYGYNVIYTYKYTGNSKDLLNQVYKRKRVVTPMEEDAA